MSPPPPELEMVERLPTTGPSTSAPAFSPEEPPITPPLVSGLAPQVTDAEPQPELLEPGLLEALGDAIEDRPIFGPQIHSVLAERWLPILRKGLTTDARDNVLKEYAVPENCKLLRAPTINPELRAAVTDTAKNRDKKIQIEQDQLGLGITALNRAMTVLLTQDNKVILYNSTYKKKLYPS